MADAVSEPKIYAAASADGETPRVTPRHAAYVVFLLAVMTMLSVTDRNILSVLLVPMQNDLRVSDTAMGALSGISFTLIYATVALPMAHLADTRNRRNIIAAAVAVWSIATAMCGLAANYFALLLARMGVAAGEASGLPSTMSMVGDLFPARRRGTVLGLITVGSAFGTALGAYVAGQLSGLFNWRVAFMVCAGPGLLLALVIFLTVREPERGLHDGGVAPAPTSNWRAALGYLFSIRSFLPLMIGQIFVGLSFSTFVSWMPAFLMRAQGLSVKEMSGWFAITTAPAILGNMFGGFLTDKMTARAPRWRVLSLAAMLAAGAPVFCVLLASHDFRVVAAMMLLYAFVVGPVASISPAANLDIVHSRARGMITAVMYFCLSVLGAGLGPVLQGAINDWAKPIYGTQYLRHTLLVLPIALCIATGCYIWASRYSDEDVAAARSGG